MAVTLGNLTDRILRETNMSGAEFTLGVKEAIVTAIKFMEMDFIWLFYKIGTITVLAGGNATSLPDDLAKLIDAKYPIGSVIYGADQGFVGIPYPDLNALFNNTTSSGYPLKYAVYGTQFYIYPYTDTDITFTLSYNYKDSFYPETDNDISIWFNDETVDAVRYKAKEVFYRDTLQSEIEAAPFRGAFKEWEQNMVIKNNNRQLINIISI